MEIKKELQRNQTFNYIYALAILMVIDDHCGTRIGIFSSIFPYNSFFMPLFVFVSGYFFKSDSFIRTIKHKIKKLLVPYLAWEIIFVFLSEILDELLGIRWLGPLSLNKIYDVLFFRSTTTTNDAAWFVIMLFWVSVEYVGIRSVVKTNITNDVVLTLFIVIVGLASVWTCIHYSPDIQVIWIYRSLFFIVFYHLGYMFNLYGEHIILKYNRMIVVCACVVVNILLILLYGDAINFYSTCYMHSFNYVILPFITSLTGIVFYYEIMDFLAKNLGDNKYISFIARNTMVIMQVHLLFVNIPNFYVFNQILNGSTLYDDFPLSDFVYGSWVRYSPNARLIGFTCGLLGSLCVAYTIEKAKERLKPIGVDN